MKKISMFLMSLCLLGSIAIAGVTPAEYKCIVSGDAASGKYSSEYQGAKYAFCCRKCMSKFKKDPAKYVAQADKAAAAKIKEEVKA